MTDPKPAYLVRGSGNRAEAFGDFYSHHFDRIVAYLARSVCDPDLALELTAETFAQAYVGWGRFRGSTPEEAQAWIYRIASRQLARYYRRGRAERRAMKRLRIELPHIDAHTRAAVDELADLEGLRSALRTELQRLPGSQRDALWLRIVEELPYAEVGHRLNISEQAARARVSRSLRSLSGALAGGVAPKEVGA